MDYQAFKEAYNSRLAAAGEQAQALRILGVVKQDGDAVVFNTAMPGINILHYNKEQASGAIVSGHMSPESSTTAVIAYAVCLDVYLQLPEKRRNKLLERLHLFDGKLTNKGSNITCQEHMLEVRPGHPAPSMISFLVTQTKEKLPSELLIMEQTGL